ncbi:FAD-dependent oxidoreductase, partial [Pseudomonas aeruginosa]
MAQRVCIIGAGVVGLATAYALVREGFDVTLVEARERGGLETSYANGGQLSYRYVAPLADSGVPAQALGWLLRNDAPLRLRPRLDPAQWRWLLGFLAACRGSLNRRNAAHLLRLALLSQRTLQDWREEDGLDGFDWRRNGKLVAFRQPASFARARQGLADPSAQFVLTAAECLALEPALSAAPFVGGIHTPDEEVADCHAFCVQLAERLQASGHCRQLHGRRVTKIVEGGAAVRGVEVGGDLIEADHVVLAAGYRSAELMLPGLRLPLYPLKGYSLTLPVGAQHRAPDTSITDYDRKIVYARIGERLRIAAMVDIVGFDPGLEPARLALLRQQARDTFPQGGDFDAAVEWAGMRPATPTGVPPVSYTHL